MSIWCEERFNNKAGVNVNGNADKTLFKQLQLTKNNL